MKKVLSLLIFTLAGLTAFAQLDMVQDVQTIAKSHYVFLKHDQSKYWVEIKDYRSANFVTLELGTSSRHAVLSLQQLHRWYKNNKVGASIIVKQQDDELTVYKASPTLLLISRANAETCRATYQSVIKTLLVSEIFAAGLIESSDIIGILTSTDLKMLNKKIVKH